MSSSILIRDFNQVVPRKRLFLMIYSKMIHRTKFNCIIILGCCFFFFFFLFDKKASSSHRPNVKLSNDFSKNLSFRGEKGKIKTAQV